MKNKKTTKTQCTDGWAERCAHSKGKKCECACGGENHGKAYHEAASVPIARTENVKITRKGLEFSGSALIVGKIGSRRVYIAGEELSPKRSQKVINHSPDGFMWGYGGSGPSQLALAILLEVDEKHADLYQQFKSEIIAGFDQHKDFEISVSKVREWIKSKI